jgi:hypothetical protein
MLCMFLKSFVIPRNLSIVAGPNGALQLMPNLVRIPDVSFVSWDRIPGGRCTAFEREPLQRPLTDASA